MFNGKLLKIFELQKVMVRVEFQGSLFGNVWNDWEMGKIGVRIISWGLRKRELLLRYLLNEFFWSWYLNGVYSFLLSIDVFEFLQMLVWDVLQNSCIILLIEMGF